MESVSVGLWSILPPLVAIVLALLTKEVIFSLACGHFSGAVIYAVAANLGVAGVFSSVSDLMIEKMGGNAALLLFVVLLGALVAVITKARAVPQHTAAGLPANCVPAPARSLPPVFWAA